MQEIDMDLLKQIRQAKIDPVPHAEGNFPPHQASVNFCLL